MATVTIDSNDSNNILHSSASTWAEAISGGSGSYGFNTFSIDAYRINTSNFELARPFLFFSLAGIPAGATISSVVLRIPAVANYASTWNGTLYVVSHTNSTGFAADATTFANIGNQTTYGSILNSAISTSANNDISLSAAGIAALITPNIGGSTKIALRHSDDIDGTAGSGSDNTGDQANIAVSTWDLIVTYTEAESILDLTSKRW
jgi:hypothetical protein